MDSKHFENQNFCSSMPAEHEIQLGRTTQITVLTTPVNLGGGGDISSCPIEWGFVTICHIWSSRRMEFG